MFARSGATVATTSEDANYPKSNIYDGSPGREFRFSADATDVNARVDIGSAQNVDFMGIFGHNLKTSITAIEFRSSTDNFAASNDLEATLVLQSITHPDASTQVVQAAGYKRLAAPVNRRYWADIFKGTNGGTPIGVGEIVFGLAVKFLKSPNLPYDVRPRFPQIRHVSAGGQIQAIKQARFAQRAPKLEWAGTRAQMEQISNQIYTATDGGVSPMVVVPDESQIDVFFTRMPAEFPIIRRAAVDRWSWTLDLEEEAFPVAVP